MDNLFIASFSRVDNSAEGFKADKRGNMPVIGQVVAGTAFGTIINGTIFQRENRVEGKLYLCQNSENAENPEYMDTNIIAEVSPIEFVTLKKDLGAPRLIRHEDTDDVPEAAEATVDESEVVGD